MATSIQSSSVLSDRPQSDGRRYVRVKFVCEDHDGGTEEVFVGPRLVASDFDVNAWLASHGDTVLAQLAERENQGITDLNAVADPLAYTLNPRWSTTKEIAKAAINWMMQEKDAWIVIYLEPLLNYIRTNYTGTQIADLLDTTVTVVQRMGRRIDAILTDTGTAKALLTSFDGEEGEL